jgi:protein-disulfide isomerase
MSDARSRRAALAAALLLAVSCGGGNAPPRSAPGAGEIDLTQRSGSGSKASAVPGDPRNGAPTAIHFEDLPVSRLERSRVPLPNAANPSLGDAKAPVVVQLWSDFECPFCAQVHPAVTEMMRAYAGRVRLVWHNYPLPFHEHARLAANAALEAYAQGGPTAFWKFHDLLYESQEGALDAAGLSAFAAKTGLDPVRFQDALKTLRHNSEIDHDMAIGDAIGVEGTPAFLVNDYFFVGAVPIEVLRVVVDRALADLGH